MARGKAMLRIALLLLFVAAFGFLIRAINTKYAGKVRGRVTAEASSFGSVAFDVTHCVAGPAPAGGVHGVDLRGEHGAALRLVDSGKGPEAWLFPRGTTISLDPVGREFCREWNVVVERIDAPGDRVRAVSGHARVACQINGGHLEADVTFERCPL